MLGGASLDQSTQVDNQRLYALKSLALPRLQEEAVVQLALKVIDFSVLVGRASRNGSQFGIYKLQREESSRLSSIDRITKMGYRRRD